MGIRGRGWLYCWVVRFGGSFFVVYFFIFRFRFCLFVEAIVESVLCKCVLKFLKEVINSCLYEIYSKDGSL